MKFAPKPHNDFREFAKVYFERCRGAAPKIQASAAKWAFEDLIPGLSDFDTRFFVDDTMTAKGWCEMSMAVGRVHFELAMERKEWARNLEHLPGVNLRWSEFFDSRFYSAEFSQWSFYEGSPDRLAAAKGYVADHVWTSLDEIHHWKKIVTYFGRYNRAIDPPVNLGPYENKYPLHSRLLHYVAPQLHAAVCLARRETKPGKLAAFRDARDLFAGRATASLMLSLIEKHYEDQSYLTEPGLSSLDDALEKYMVGVINILLPGSMLDCPLNPTAAQLKDAIAQVSNGSSFSHLLENLKFARLMKGRLWFYGQEIPWFDSIFLIRNELNRMRTNFLEVPLQLFALLIYGRNLGADAALDFMHGDVFDTADVQACRKIARLADPRCPTNDLKNRAREIAAEFDGFLCALERLLALASAKIIPGVVAPSRKDGIYAHRLYGHTTE